MRVISTCGIYGVRPTTMTFKFIIRRVQSDGLSSLYYRYFFFFFCPTIAHICNTRIHVYVHETLWFRKKNSFPSKYSVCRKFDGFFFSFFTPFYKTSNKDVNGNTRTICTHTYLLLYIIYTRTMEEVIYINENAVAGKFCVSDDYIMCDLCSVVCCSIRSAYRGRTCN